MSKEKITIVGGGNGGFAAAADLTIQGHQVTLFEVPAFKASLDEAIKAGGIDLECLPSNGIKPGFAKIHKFTIDPAEAMKDSDIVLIIAPSYSLNTLAKMLAPFVRENHIISLCPANFGGSVYVRKIMLENGCTVKNLKVAEFSCMMYATRKKDAKSVYIRGYKHNLGFSVFPSEGQEEIFKRMQAIYPILIPYGNIIETGLSNLNTFIHTPIMMGNIAGIQSQADLLFYRECLTEGIGYLADALDRERLQFNKLESMNVVPLYDMTKGWYEYQGAVGNNLRELMNSNPTYYMSKLPTTLDHRYMTEDVPYGLIPIEQLLIELGFEHEVTTAIIRICITACGVDFYKDARTLEELGMKGLNSKQLMSYLKTGAY